MEQTCIKTIVSYKYPSLKLKTPKCPTEKYRTFEDNVIAIRTSPATVFKYNNPPIRRSGPLPKPMQNVEVDDEDARTDVAYREATHPAIDRDNDILATNLENNGGMGNNGFHYITVVIDGICDSNRMHGCLASRRRQLYSADMRTKYSAAKRFLDKCTLGVGILFRKENATLVLNSYKRPNSFKSDMKSSFGTFEVLLSSERNILLTKTESGLRIASPKTIPLEARPACHQIKITGGINTQNNNKADQCGIKNKNEKHIGLPRKHNKAKQIKPRNMFSLKKIKYTRVLNKATDRSVFRIGKDGDERFGRPTIRPLESDKGIYDNGLVRYPVQEDRHNHVGNVQHSHPSQASDDLHDAYGLPVNIIDAQRCQLQTKYHNRPRLLNPARHPDYQSLLSRQDTFCTWPHLLDTQGVTEIAQSGLFYTGNQDLVRCFHCGIGLKDWTSADDPLQVHIRHSPHCEFLQAAIPQSELDAYRDILLIANGQNDTETDFHLRLNESNTLPRPQPSQVRYRNPNYQEYDARVASFSHWPSVIIQTPQQLAEAGFFYTGIEDIVRCYACHGGLRKWDPGDDPWIEHAHWFPHCVHVLRERGQEYVNLIQVAAVDDHEEPVKSRHMEHLYINTKTGRESDDPIYSPDAQTALDFGFSRAAVKLALQECNNKHIRWTTEDLVNRLIEKQEMGDNLPHYSPRTQSPLLPKCDVTTMDGIIAEHEILVSRLKCIMCDVEEVNVLFLPCAHHNMCMTCANDVTMCPMCTKSVKEKLKTLMT